MHKSRRYSKLAALDFVSSLPRRTERCIRYVSKRGTSTLNRNVLDRSYLLLTACRRGRFHVDSWPERGRPVEFIHIPPFPQGAIVLLAPTPHEVLGLQGQMFAHAVKKRIGERRSVNAVLPAGRRAIAPPTRRALPRGFNPSCSTRPRCGGAQSLPVLQRLLHRLLLSG